MKFNYANATRLLFGQGQIAAITQYVPEDAKVLFAYGGGSIKKNGVYDQVIKALEGFDVTEFSGIEPNPTYETLNKAVALVREKKLDYILAVGGGSVIDGCKYISASTFYDGDGWDLLTGAHTTKQALPIGAILTLPATGSESNGGAVISKKATQEKLPFLSPLLCPQFAVLDPDTMKTLPERQLKNGIVDAFVHTCEQYITYPAGSMVHDGYAETLLRTLISLGKSYDERDSDFWRENLMWAANQALNGLLGTGVPNDWATHEIGHELTARYGIDHAQTLSIIQPSLLRSQIKAKRIKLEQMGKNVFGLEAGDNLAERTVDAIEAFYRELGMPVRLSDKGVTDPAEPNALYEIIKTRPSMQELGEHKNITPEVALEILKLAA